MQVEIASCNMAFTSLGKRNTFCCYTKVSKRLGVTDMKANLCSSCAWLNLATDWDGLAIICIELGSFLLTLNKL